MVERSTGLSLVGGGGKSSTGFSANVVGAIVISSSISVRAIIGVAGRIIASGGGGISISGGSDGLPLHALSVLADTDGC